MPHHCTPHEANTLHYLALSLRPDWTQNQPGPTWNKTNPGPQGNTITLPHATNFHHALHALIHYATHTTNNQPTKRTPNLYPQPGTHWTTTQHKTNPGVAQPTPPCPDHPEDPGGTHNCAGCWADIKTGHRPPELLGKRLEATPGSHVPVIVPSGRPVTGSVAADEGLGGGL